MTREEAVTVLKGLMKNPLFSEVHKVAFNIAIHDIKQRHEWDNNNLILINKDDYEPQEPKPMVEIDLYSVIKQKYIEREVLDKIRAEIIEKFGESECAEECGCLYEILDIIDKHKGETEE